jgi:type I restriction enzyme R subunit
VQQAKQYAEMLGVKIAYATNGREISEFDYATGREQTVAGYPTPAELWQRYRIASGLEDQAAADRLLTLGNYQVGKGERYYQQIAINRAVETILKGQRRLLITTSPIAISLSISQKTGCSRPSAMPATRSRGAR